VKVFDSFSAPPAPPPPPPVTPQTLMRLSIAAADPIEQGTYRLIVRVNGQQARNSPTVDLTS
jgi:hypothetical protein